MPLRYLGVAVDFFRECSRNNFCRPGSQPHTCAFVTYAALLFQQRDDRVRIVLVELGAVGVFDSTYVSGEFNRGHLHAQAQTKERDSVLASVTRGVDFSFRSANAKSTGNENAGYIFQLVIDAIREGFSIDKFEIDSAVFARGGVGQ